MPGRICSSDGTSARERNLAAARTSTWRRSSTALALASVCLVWGSTYLFIRLALEGYPPFLLGGTRFATLSLLYLAVVGSIAGFGTYAYLRAHARPAAATSYAYVNPPIAVLLGVLAAAKTAVGSGT